MKAFLFIILGLVYAASGQTVKCPGLYTAVGSGCYIFPEISITWTNANIFCQFSGGYLANIDSSVEQSALKSYYAAHFNNTIVSRWIGATDSLSDGIWRWVPSGAKVTYSNWFTNEPGTGDTYNCAVWSPTTDFWSTLECCSFHAYALCEALPL